MTAKVIAAVMLVMIPSTWGERGLVAVSSSYDHVIAVLMVYEGY